MNEFHRIAVAAESVEHPPRDTAPVVLYGRTVAGEPWSVTARYDASYADRSRWRGPNNVSIRALFGIPEYWSHE